MDGEQKLRTAAVKVLEKLGYVVNLKRGESVTAKRKRHAATGDLGGAMQSFRAMASAIPLPPMIEARRQRVLAMLAENPGTRLALVTDTQAEPESVIVTVGVRDKGTADLRIPRERYDGLKVLALIESIGGGCPAQGR